MRSRQLSQYYSPQTATRSRSNVLLLLPLGEVRDEERQRRVDAALLEVSLKLGLDAFIEVVKLSRARQRQVARTVSMCLLQSRTWYRERYETHGRPHVESLALPVVLGGHAEGEIRIRVEGNVVDGEQAICNVRDKHQRLVFL